ncbi:MAG: PrsW family glutamic-type intramembrane protease [Candidatus Kapaibacterium sp.]
MQLIIQILTVALPVIAFLGLLLALDSFKLVRASDLFVSLALGVAAASLSLVINNSIREIFEISYNKYAQSGGPAVEEIVKMSFLAFMILRGRIGFMIDGAILGFAVGAGFAVVENILFVGWGISASWPVLIVRGFGTAIMHGGTLAVAAIVAFSFINRTGVARLIYILPGLLISLALHMMYNQFLLPPLISSIIIIVLMPALLIVVFALNEKSLSDWLEIEFDEEVDLLKDINRGEFSNSRAGRYFMKIRHRFPPEVVFDLLCYIRLSLELSLQAKASIMLREAGVGQPDDPELHFKFAELEALKKNIGKTGLIALAPILPSDHKDLWKLRRLG